MNPIPSFNFQGVETPHFDDKMELATSPYRQTDDLDVEFDAMRDASVEPFIDQMTDDAYNHQQQYDYDAGVTIDTSTGLERDDDMLDEDVEYDIQDLYHEDHQMESNNIEAEMIEDEGILYDDDQELEDLVDDGNHHLGTDENGADQPDPQDQSMRTQATQETVVSGQLGMEATQRDSSDLENTGQYVVDEGVAKGETDQHEIIQSPQSHTLPESATSIRSKDILLAKATNTTIVQDENQEREHVQLVSDRQHNGFEGGDVEPEGNDVSAYDWAERSTPVDDTVVAAAAQKSQDDGHGANAARETVTDQPQKDAESPHTSLILTPDLHPVTVVYLGEEMSLFPPSHDVQSTTYFLADATLAFESLDKLLASCRDVLSGSIGHDDELVLDFSSLGLHICEDSKYVSAITLAQVIEVYLGLTQNDQKAEVGPLYCSLSTRVCLGSQYAYLVEAARVGKTYSEIAAEYAESSEQHSDHAEQEYPVTEPTVGVHAQGSIEPVQAADQLIRGLEPVAQYPALTRADENEESADDAGHSLETESSLLSSHVPEESAEAGRQHDSPQATQPAESEATDQPEVKETSRSDEHFPPDKESLEAAYEDDDAAGTESSHTVEAEISKLAESDEQFEEENPTTIVEVEQSTQPYDPLDLEDLAEDAEDLFDQDVEHEEPRNIDDAEADIDDDGHSLIHSSGKTSQTSIEPVTEDDPSTTSLVGNSNKEHSQSAPQPEIAAPPRTPSKPSTTKRRIEDDDDYGLLENGTPEPKRSRSSK